MSFVHVPGNPPPFGAEPLWVEGEKGIRLRACFTPATSKPRGTIIIFPGFTEFLEKYFETATDLQGRGFASFIMDWRGQGLSERTQRNPHVCHLNNFNEPVRDMAAALQGLERSLPRPWVIMAHSMGGAIALRGLMDFRLEAKAAIFSAPMWGIQAATPFNRFLAKSMRFLGLGHLPTSFVAKNPKEEKFETNSVTSDPARFARNWLIWRTEPGLRIAGPSFGWFAAACDAVKSFERGKTLDRLWLPVTVISARDERLVINEAHASVVKRLPNAVHGVIEGAKHELLQEKDTYRDQFLTALDALLERAGI